MKQRMLTLLLSGLLLAGALTGCGSNTKTNTENPEQGSMITDGNAAIDDENGDGIVGNDGTGWDDAQDNAQNNNQNNAQNNNQNNANNNNNGNSIVDDAQNAVDDAQRDIRDGIDDTRDEINNVTERAKTSAQN